MKKVLEKLWDGIETWHIFTVGLIGFMMAIAPIFMVR